jgi:glutathione peroxidase-family protein
LNLLEKNPKDATSASSLYDFFAQDIDGKDVALDAFKGDVLLVVNAASG